MTKGGKLIWELFLMLREVMPNTEANTKRQHEWAAVFHEMEPDAAAAPPAPPAEEPATTAANAGASDDDVEEEAGDPHEHGVPQRPRTRKKR